jgi:hypothetical protein
MVTITAAERDALCERIYLRLSGIGDVWLAVERDDLGTAARLGREFSDELRLLLDDLGWGKGTGQSLKLRTPPEVLRRVFRRMEVATEAERAFEERERLEAREREAVASRLVETCRRVLGELEA